MIQRIIRHCIIIKQHTMSNRYIAAFEEAFQPHVKILYDPSLNNISGVMGAENKQCFLISIRGTRMELLKLAASRTNNNEYSGSDILRRIHTAAHNLGITQIILTDSSELLVPGDNNPPICFWRYHILLHGISWYNKFGYFSKQHIDETRHNAFILNEPLSNYSRFAEYALFRKYFPDANNDISVHEAMILLDKQRKTSKVEDDDDLYTLIQFLVLEPPLKYNSRLINSQKNIITRGFG
jgi:hypothetical protein